MTPGNFQLIDPASGEVVLTQIHLWPNDCGECAMCGEERRLDHAVAWYCGPTHDEIGSVTTEYTDGGIVGGMCVCKKCHDGHYALSTLPERGEPQEGGAK